MPAIASTTAPTTSPSSATWPSISFARSRQRAPCASRSSGRDGRTHSSPKSSLKFEMRLPWSLDWFHVAMRLRHAEKTAGTLPIDTPERENARAVIVAEVDRLHGRIWNGKAKDAQITLERIRKLMPAFHGDGGRKKDPAWRRLWKALREIDRYLSSQGTWLVNYAERHRAGLRVGTSLTEATANFLVNRRMNKSQHMRWSRRGADLLLQVRCAVLNGTLGSGYGQKFYPANDTQPQAAIAA